MKAIDHTNEVSAARMFPVLRARAEAGLLRVFDDMKLREVLWHTHDEIREYPVANGMLAFIPCTFVFNDRKDKGYTLLIFSETLPDRWRPVSLFYFEDQLCPELISRLAIDDLAPLFQSRQSEPEESKSEGKFKDSIAMIRIVAMVPAVATIGLAISYIYTGEVIFDVGKRWYHTGPPGIVRHPVDLFLFFTGWCLLTASALIWGFRDVPQSVTSRIVWWLGYGGVGLILMGHFLAYAGKLF